jgi:hypothetical protein
MQKSQLGNYQLQHKTSIPDTTKKIDLGLSSHLGNFIIIDDSQRSQIVKLITDLLNAKIPVTMINDQEQGLPFQEVFYDFDGKYVHLNPDTISLNSVNIEKDILVEISGHQIATYLLEKDPILFSIERLLKKRLTSSPLSFVIVETINSIDNNILKFYLDQILNSGKSGVQAIWSFNSIDQVSFPSHNYYDRVQNNFPTLLANSQETSKYIENSDNN